MTPQPQKAGSSGVLMCRALNRGCGEDSRRQTGGPNRCNAYENGATKRTFRQSSGGNKRRNGRDSRGREHQKREGLESSGCLMCCEGCVVNRNAQLSQIEQGPWKKTTAGALQEI
jgi:hypothetical protein